MTIEILAGKQNRDGGWPYVRGASWTEPTVYAVLALLAAGETEPAGRGLRWILATGRPDGGWPPQAGVDQSTWVTALVALLPPEQLGAAAHAARHRMAAGNHRPGIHRGLPLAGVASGQPAATRTGVSRLALDTGRGRMGGSDFAGDSGAGKGVPPEALAGHPGTNRFRPAVPADAHVPRRRMEPRLGASPGIRVAPLPGNHRHGAGGPARRPVARHGARLAVARRFLGECRSADALNWLRLGLLAHGQLPAGYCHPVAVEYRTLPETSLGLLVAEAEKGRDFFLA